MKKFEHILIASDIDGTLLWKSQYIHPRNFEKLRYFCENGGHFALSSGRNCKDVFVISEELYSYINMPCILCNGSYLFDTETDEILNPHYLNPIPLIEAFKEMKRKYDTIGCRATIKEGFLCPEEDDIALAFLKASNLGNVAFSRPVAEFENEKIFKAVFVSEDTKSLRSLQNDLLEHYASDFSITTSDDTILEVMPIGISKKTQFTYLKKRYPKIAFKYFSYGEQFNDANAINNLATMYEHGIGTEKDELKALRLYKKAARSMPRRQD